MIKNLFLAILLTLIASTSFAAEATVRESFQLNGSAEDIARVILDEVSARAIFKASNCVILREYENKTKEIEKHSIKGKFIFTVQTKLLTKDKTKLIYTKFVSTRSEVSDHYTKIFIEPNATGSNDIRIVIYTKVDKNNIKSGELAIESKKTAKKMRETIERLILR